MPVCLDQVLIGEFSRFYLQKNVTLKRIFVKCIFFEFKKLQNVQFIEQRIRYCKKNNCNISTFLDLTIIINNCFTFLFTALMLTTRLTSADSILILRRTHLRTLFFTFKKRLKQLVKSECKKGYTYVIPQKTFLPARALFSGSAF